MKIKYFLRGLGFGILITAFLLGIGAKKSGNAELDDAQIITRARQLGMITRDEAMDYKMDTTLDNIKESMSVEKGEAPEVTQAALETKEEQEVEKKEQSPASEKPDASDVSSEKDNTTNTEDKKNKGNKRKTISITIEPGMVSQSIAKYLYQKSVIGSASDFNSYMQEHEVTEKLRAGEFEIPVDASYEEIVDIIT